MEKRLAEILATRELRRITDETLIPSAVLIPLLKKDGEYHILFTKRSENVEYHKGEISFPGGTIDADDKDALQTALREGAEEIGLDPRDVAILGRLDDIRTRTTRFIITPFVGIIPYPYPFQVNTDEIAGLIFAPMRSLTEECSVSASAETGQKQEVSVQWPYFCYRDNIIWGATARILKQFLELIRAIR